MGNNDEKCKGCKTSMMGRCDLSVDVNGVECPCLKCIVQSTCDESCEGYLIYSGFFYASLRIEMEEEFIEKPHKEIKDIQHERYQWK